MLLEGSCEEKHRLGSKLQTGGNATLNSARTRYRSTTGFYPLGISFSVIFCVGFHLTLCIKVVRIKRNPQAVRLK